MDDGRLANEMTLEGIAKQLQELDRKVSARFDRVDEQLNAAKVRDEELNSLFTFSLEANEALRESTDARFVAANKKHDEQIGLLKDVLREVARPRT